jgi:hypothetical protein
LQSVSSCRVIASQSRNDQNPHCFYENPPCVTLRLFTSRISTAVRPGSRTGHEEISVSPSAFGGFILSGDGLAVEKHFYDKTVTQALALRLTVCCSAAALFSDRLQQRVRRY